MIADAGSVCVMQRRSWFVGLAIALQAAVAVSLLMIGPGDSTTRAPVIVVGPSVVAPLVAERANAVQQQPFDAWAETSADSAQRALVEGRAVAMLEIDLAADQDTVTLAGGNGAALDRALIDQTTSLEATYGRDVVVQRADGPDQDRRIAYILVGISIVLGFAASFVSWWIRGPADSDRLSLVTRLGRQGAFALAVGVGAALVGGIGWLALGAVLSLTASLVSSALMAVFDLPGLLIATTVFIVVAAPLGTFTHPLLLHGPWAAVTPFLPHGAGLHIAQSLALGGTGQLRSWLVLGCYVVVPAVALMSARRTRPAS